MLAFIAVSLVFAVALATFAVVEEGMYQGVRRILRQRSGRPIS